MVVPEKRKIKASSEVRMKKIIVIVMLAMLASTFAYCAQAESENVKSQTISNWRQLKSGMTESQVRSIMGEPKRVEIHSYTNEKDWEYEYFGKVTFSNDNILFTYKVISWSEPNESVREMLTPTINIPNNSTSNTGMPNDPKEPVFIGAIILLIVLFFIMFYFLPSIIAGSKKKRNAGAIFALNLLLGWTFIGWVIAFVWSLTHDN